MGKVLSSGHSTSLGPKWEARISAMEKRGKALREAQVLQVWVTSILAELGGPALEFKTSDTNSLDPGVGRRGFYEPHAIIWRSMVQ